MCQDISDNKGIELTVTGSKGRSESAHLLMPET